MLLHHVLAAAAAERILPASPHRTQFSKWWQSEWKNVQFPEKGLVFDYFVDEQQCLMVPWDERVPKFTYMPDNFTNMFVPTVETTRLTYFLDSLVANKHYAMFVGNTGTGKTAIMMNKLKNMDAETMSYYTINMNSFSDAPSLQVSRACRLHAMARANVLRAG